MTRGRGAQTAGKPMGCLRVELAGLEVHDPPELQLLLVGDRGTSSAQPGKARSQLRILLGIASHCVIAINKHQHSTAINKHLDDCKPGDGLDLLSAPLVSLASGESQTS